MSAPKSAFHGRSPHIFHCSEKGPAKSRAFNSLTLQEAPTGFEPVHKGFADLSLTAWVRRHMCSEDHYTWAQAPGKTGSVRGIDSNPRLCEVSQCKQSVPGDSRNVQWNDRRRAVA